MGLIYLWMEEEHQVYSVMEKIYNYIYTALAHRCMRIIGTFINYFNEGKLRNRKNEFKPKEIKYKKGVLAKYAKLVNSSSNGAVTD